MLLRSLRMHVARLCVIRTFVVASTFLSSKHARTPYLSRAAFRRSTCYLKQILQTVLQGIPGVKRVVNRIEVICPQGLSGCSRITRDRCALEYFWLKKTPRCFPTCDGKPGFVIGEDAGEVQASPNQSHSVADATYTCKQ
jgi:hypothetical protein